MDRHIDKFDQFSVRCMMNSRKRHLTIAQIPLNVVGIGDGSAAKPGVMLTPVWHGLNANSIFLISSLLLNAFLVWRFIVQDYCDFLALGPGGTPHTTRGYLQISFFRFCRIRNTHKAAPTPKSLWIQDGFLHALPERRGPRPDVRGIAPQRQMDQHGSEPKVMFDKLSAFLTGFPQYFPSDTCKTTTFRFRPYSS